MTDNIKLPPFPEGLCLREDIEDYAREAVRLNAQAAPVELDRYDPGLLGGQDGMPAYVWHDIIRSELDRAYDFYMGQIDRVAPQPAEPVKRKRRYAQGTALGELGIIPMCDQVDDEPVKVPSDDLAHEIWAAAQTATGEGIEDAVERVAALLAREAVRELLRESLEALTCGDTGDDLEDSHRCGRCDEYVDRNAKLRVKIRAALAREQGGSDAPEA